MKPRMTIDAIATAIVEASTDRFSGAYAFDYDDVPIGRYLCEVKYVVDYSGYWDHGPPETSLTDVDITGLKVLSVMPYGQNVDYSPPDIDLPELPETDDTPIDAGEDVFQPTDQDVPELHPAAEEYFWEHLADSDGLRDRIWHKEGYI